MRRRIIICLGVLLFLCLLGDAVTMVCLGGSIRQLTAVAESRRVQSLRAELASSAIRVERDLLAMIAKHEPDRGFYADGLARFRVSADRCNRCHHEPPIQAELDAVNDAFRDYRQAADPLFASINGGDQSETEEAATQHAHRLAALTTELADRAGKHVTTRAADAAAGVRRAWMALSASLALVLVTGGFVAFHLERRLTIPVAALLEGIDRIRRGDRSHKLSVKADEEFRMLGDALNQAYSNLNSAHDSVLQAEKLATAGRLAAGVAHEVSNPLASISSIVQVMRRHASTDQHQEQTDLIMREVSRISRIVRELLTFSRPGGSDKRGPVDVGSLLDHATKLIRYDKRADHIEITCRKDESLPQVMANADRLLLVFTNILINALDAMSTVGTASGSLSIIAEHHDGSIMVRFEDTGHGMTPKQVSEAFEPFFTTKDPGVGTGLGLWVCYQVVQAHHGTIELDSEPGKGTTVAVTLPAVDTEG